MGSGQQAQKFPEIGFTRNLGRLANNRPEKIFAEHRTFERAHETCKGFLGHSVSMSGSDSFFHFFFIHAKMGKKGIILLEDAKKRQSQNVYMLFLAHT